MNQITLAVNNGRIITTSHAVAKHFGKRHADVLRAIEDLECSEDFRVRNFALMQNVIETHNGASREVKAYEITRDGFTFLAMGFTGKAAAVWKERYINAFNEMEAEKVLQNSSQNAALIHQLKNDIVAIRWAVLESNRLWSKICRYRSLGLSSKEMVKLLAISRRTLDRHTKRMAFIGLVDYSTNQKNSSPPAVDRNQISFDF